ncbi:aminoglycoside phosphotransferase family protein [Streptomyces sp. Ag109_G2-15]|uniref:aminoglycoside phosphotransferase family protein n=1 Tax=Streptomyces sp. Ag109_G2-15 TaxID=1938850 RepID=UPI000BC638FB|nr:aminoglycoside phosphotransferase family protein [Streptomyces sp. Ag109_G2-15]SOD85591.1 Predicted kinase, aminoglycoside phosphotransferase (APT) family [Streptomyces sp. Ag109_G2-15]
MGAPPVPPLRPGSAEGVRAAAVYEAFLELAYEQGQASNGFHNHNYVLPLTDRVAQLVGREPGTPVIARVRRMDALRVVIRTWDDEPKILRALGNVLTNVPECLAEGEGFALHSYVDGVPLSSLCPNGKPVDRVLVKALAGLLADNARVGLGELLPLPSAWPVNHTDSCGFLQTLAQLAEVRIRQHNWPYFGGLFMCLGVPEDALTKFAERVPAMARRPYHLLHADLHRDNVIMSYDGDPPLICVDWELATFGDPLHDLATHLVRMQYPAHQWDEVVEAWAGAMLEVRPAAVRGVARDLRHYVAFERAQSVYPDVMRAAKSLEDSYDQQSLDKATNAVRTALEAAAEPLRLSRVPAVEEIETILLRWRTAAQALGGGWRGRVRQSFEWKPDRRLPERPDFPLSAVSEALTLEATAASGRVFRGVAHVNTVVQVPDIGFPVVVRRGLMNVVRRERSFLSEHAVLRAIERSCVAVAAPRVLALGESLPKGPDRLTRPGDRFAIQTYEARDARQHPSHPVNGLLPHEADGLVDQLAALTAVDYRLIDPVTDWTGFYDWLSDQLVALVARLPQESLQLARFLGLPDAPRLREILARHQVAHRAPALLHGDLNPWNLVRRDDGLALTLIDWEMALVGDPLYDLVRHMHLTPTRPEIRDRLFRRWERRLPSEYTWNWREDWQVYRWTEIVRSAYVDLDRLVTGASREAPNVRRALDSYAMTLAAATASLGLAVPRRPNPYLARALA